MAVYPLVFEPIYKGKIWGGDRIFRRFARIRRIPGPIGESWELADLEEDQSQVRNGPCRGSTLGDLRRDWGADLFGEVEPFEGRFPLLVKYLDAQTSLSVQVHPSEAVARRLGGQVRVKHEAWYVLDAESGGAIYHGLEPGVDGRTFREAMLTGQVDGVLRDIPVVAGDCYYLPSGTPHALGAGVLVAEVQTPSDVTYRTYDWGRIDPTTGRPRLLHLDQAIECIDFSSPSPPPRQGVLSVGNEPGEAASLARCECFEITRCLVSGGGQGAIELYGCPAVWMMLEGAGEILHGGDGESVRIVAGDVVLLPAALPKPVIRIGQAATWLKVTVPPAKS
ncbi:MAG TPA: class I mannose-6-phosphate isomerase [Phycisphaerae bacterium]|nr:class I mannose-6-phosphate isomerase [Phycisphaerae bacterium]HRY70536.1 class I mannose-6-phosphate isomerase [Phycisphaerae bacterium]HSA27984.1 class I mannose-6-phosphate isomerase [Phycisphaerae bacterium]